MWIIENSRLTNTKFTEYFPGKAVEKPYPKILWRIENGRLTHKLLNIYLGAFENAGKLGKIVIPESVKKIGGNSFSGTLLKSVKIAKDCEYSETSFPEDCAVEFYE